MNNAASTNSYYIAYVAFCQALICILAVKAIGADTKVQCTSCDVIY